ncbi:hypothetical protein [Metabacillus fastidiosus]|uniref:Uncharacterized protein n=2 Tax=Metabacillus fastidiosus TaxID=1458 RepID=A0ABU6NSE2_9BACI|nr:hypothetical protein [Metabacillus fastidiosus]
MIALIPFKLTLDFLEERDMCYQYIPFCESKQEKAEKEFEQTSNEIYFRVKDLSRNSGVEKWKTITEYRTKNGGYIYYLGTNSANGIFLYWNGEANNYKLYSLDYQAQDKLRIKIYEGEDRIKLMDEFLDSEEVRELNEEFNQLFN